MKVRATTRHQTTLTGTVEAQELADWIAGQLKLPPKSVVELWVGDDPHDLAVNLGNPLQFRVTYSGEITTPPPTAAAATTDPA